MQAERNLAVAAASWTWGASLSPGARQLGPPDANAGAARDPLPVGAAGPAGLMPRGFCLHGDATTLGELSNY